MPPADPRTLAALRLPTGGTWLDLAHQVADEEQLPIDAVLVEDAEAGFTLPDPLCHLWYEIRLRSGAPYRRIAEVFGVRSGAVFAGVRRYAQQEGAPADALAKPGLAYLPGLRAAAPAPCSQGSSKIQSDNTPPPRTGLRQGPQSMRRHLWDHRPSAPRTTRSSRCSRAAARGAGSRATRGGAARACSRRRRRRPSPPEGVGDGPSPRLPPRARRAVTAPSPSPLEAGIILARFLDRTGLADLADALLAARNTALACDQRLKVEQLLVDHRMARRFAEATKTKDPDAIAALRRAVELLEVVHGALAPSAAPPPATPSIAEKGQV